MTKNCACCTIILLLVLTATVARSQTPESLFRQGNTLYQQGRFAEARSAYEQILKSGFVSGEVLFNLGNAYYKTGDIAKAILYYERARRLMPGDDDLLHNLQLANLQIADRLEPTPDSSSGNSGTACADRSPWSWQRG